MAHNPNVRHFDQAKQTSVTVNGNPLIGIMIGLARNAQNEEVGKDLQFAIAGFSDKAVNWLAKGQSQTIVKQVAAPIATTDGTVANETEVVANAQPAKKSRLREGTCLTQVWDFHKNRYICENDPNVSKRRGELVGVSTGLEADQTASASAATQKKIVKESRLRKGTCLTKVWDFRRNTFVCENDPKASKGRGEISGKPINPRTTFKTKTDKRIWKGQCPKVWDRVLNNYVCTD